MGPSDPQVRISARAQGSKPAPFAILSAAKGALKLHRWSSDEPGPLISLLPDTVFYRFIYQPSVADGLTHQ
jgi:hypothetical protein